MKATKFFQLAVTTVAIVGMCCSQLVFAVEPVPAVVDIALADGGVLHGQVVDLQGGGVAGVPVSVNAQSRQVATVTTAADGTFGVQGLRGGAYQLAAGNGQGAYRLWSAGTAPPVAQTAAILHTENGAADSNIVYTQNGGGQSTWKMLLTNPIVIAGIVATAIAVPVALANSHSSSP